MSRANRWDFAGVKAVFDDAAERDEVVQLRWLRAARKQCCAVLLLCGEAPEDGFIIAVPGGFLTAAELASEEKLSGEGVMAWRPAHCRAALLSGFPSEDLSTDLLLLTMQGAVASELLAFRSGSLKTLVRFFEGSDSWPYVPDLLDIAAVLVAEGGYAVADDGAGDALGSSLGDFVDVEPPGGESSDLVEAAPSRPPRRPTPRTMPSVARAELPLPPVPGGARGAAVVRDVASAVADLQRDVRKMQDELGSPRAAATPLVARPSTPLAADPQFFEEGARLGLDDAAMQRLLGLAGKAPQRLREPTLPAVDPGAAAHATLEASSTKQAPPWAEVTGVPRRTPMAASSSDPAPAAGPPQSGPSPDMMTILLQQNQVLMNLLAGSPSAKKPSFLDILSGGSGDALDEGKAVSGARGCAARIALKEQMAMKPRAVIQSLRRNLSRALDKAPDKVDSGDMRQFFIRDVPLGNFLCLTYFSFLCAKMWEEAEAVASELDGSETDPKLVHLFDLLHMTIGLSCAFAEQVAVEGGNRYQLGWLITNQEDPPFSVTQQHKSRPGSVPHGKLVEPAWIAAQLAYLKDLDVMAERIRKRPAPGQPEGRNDEKAGK